MPLITLLRGRGSQTDGHAVQGLLQRRCVGRPSPRRAGQVGNGLLRRLSLSGGRRWWAHFEFTRINIEPIILRKKIEDAPEAGANW
jgi:hypothetical protein